jgi:hypothetical protein
MVDADCYIPRRNAEELSGSFGLSSGSQHYCKLIF